MKKKQNATTRNRIRKRSSQIMSRSQTSAKKTEETKDKIKPNSSRINPKNKSEQRQR